MRPGFLWLAGFRDLQWRRRRFVIAVLGSSLVFALTLMLAGFLGSFTTEINRTTSVIGAHGYIVKHGRPGPFTGVSPLPIAAIDAMRQTPGVTRAHGLVSALQVIDRGEKPDVYVVGGEPGGFGVPKPTTGTVPRQSGDATVDKSAGFKMGDRFVLNGLQFTVVGLTSNVTVLGNQPVVFMLLEDAQRAIFGRTDVVTTIGVDGVPSVVPPGLAYVNETVARADLLRPQKDTVDSIKIFRIMLWIVAAAIIGSVVYLSALERLGDFAVFKAVGTATSDLLGALVIQAVIVSVSASILSILVARLLGPLMPVRVLFPARNLMALPIVGLVIGVVASGAALRRAVTVDPALAFGGH